MLAGGIDVQTSITHNVGLFATRPIPAGTAIWLPCPKCSRWSKEETAELPQERFAALDKYGHLLADGSLLLPCLGAYLMNHSCEANVLDLGLDFGLAVRDIFPGEEVTCDYSTFVEDEGWSMACNCRTASCRREVTTAQGTEQRLRDHWLARVDPALPAVRSVEQPLHDVLAAVSTPYHRILQGGCTIAEVASGASVCAPAFLTA